MRSTLVAGSTLGRLAATLCTSFTRVPLITKRFNLVPASADGEVTADLTESYLFIYLFNTPEGSSRIYNKHKSQKKKKKKQKLYIQ